MTLCLRHLDQSSRITSFVEFDATKRVTLTARCEDGVGNTHA